MRRVSLAAAMAVLTFLPAVAYSQIAPAGPLTGRCEEFPDGGRRCESSDGHVRTETPDEYGRIRTTSTDSRDWGRPNGYGTGITPPPGMLDHRPEYRRDVYGRVTEPWGTKKKSAPSQPRVLFPLPETGPTRCVPDGEKIRCGPAS